MHFPRKFAEYGEANGSWRDAGLHWRVRGLRVVRVLPRQLGGLRGGLRLHEGGGAARFKLLRVHQGGGAEPRQKYLKLDLCNDVHLYQRCF